MLFLQKPRGQITVECLMLDKNGFGRLPTWQDALSRYLKEIDY